MYGVGGDFILGWGWDASPIPFSSKGDMRNHIEDRMLDRIDKQNGKSNKAKEVPKTATTKREAEEKKLLDWLKQGLKKK